MTSQERRLRHREELRAAIVDAALEIVSREGLGALSIRAIADRVEYASATIYLYFDSKEALLREVARDGFRRLHEALRAAAASADGGDAVRLRRAFIKAYIDFALTNPAHFRVMFEPPAAGTAPVVDPVSAESECAVRREVQAAMERVGAAESAIATFAAAHGLASLYLAGRLADLARSPEQLVELVESCLATERQPARRTSCRETK